MNSLEMAATMLDVPESELPMKLVEMLQRADDLVNVVEEAGWRNGVHSRQVVASIIVAYEGTLLTRL